MPEIAPKESTVKSLKQIGRFFCLTAIFICTSFLVLPIMKFSDEFEWTYNNDFLPHPLTAIIYIIYGVSILLIYKKPTPDKKKNISQSLVFLVISFIIYKILSLTFGFPYLPEELLFKAIKSGNLVGHYFPLQIVFAVLMAVNILFLDSKVESISKNIQFISYFLILFSMLNIYGFIFQIEILLSVNEKLLPVTFGSSAAVFLLANTLLFIRPNQGSMRYLVGQNPSKILFIRFIALLAPLILGWLEIYGERIGIYSKEFGKAILVTCSFALTMVLLGIKSRISYKDKYKSNQQIEAEKIVFLRFLGFHQH